MQANLTKLANRRKPDPLRACVHDLRNLFAVVASAKSLLERPIDPERKTFVLDALGRIAIEGKILTDALLAGDRDDRASATETAGELKGLAPIIAALDRPGRTIDIAIDDQPAWISMPASEFRAIVLELVTNAAAAGARAIRIRGSLHGSRYWLLAGDNGSGFAQMASVPVTGLSGGLHGTGLGRLAAAADSANGALRIRSCGGRGSVVALVVPVSSVPPAPARPVASPRAAMAG